MDYTLWCQKSAEILAQAEEYNKWRKLAKENLLTRVGPQLATLGKTGYFGSGCHYSLEQEFGSLIKKLALPWQPCANHCDKIEDDILRNMTREVIYEDLLEQVAMAFVEQKSFDSLTPEEREMYEVVKDQVEIIDGKVVRKD